jgi:hypothetical protein
MEMLVHKRPLLLSLAEPWDIGTLEKETQHEIPKHRKISKKKIVSQCTRQKNFKERVINSLKVQNPRRMEAKNRSLK